MSGIEKKHTAVYGVGCVCIVRMCNKTSVRQYNNIMLYE